ncbi:MAG: CcdB family protein [Pseudomonadota bacterium]
MPQFSVYRNKNSRTKSTFPLLLDVQTDLLEDLQTRVVIPLTKAATLTRKPMSQLTPAIEHEGSLYLLMTPLLAGIARGDLGAEAGTLAEHRKEIIGAMDFLLTGF